MAFNAAPLDPALAPAAASASSLPLPPYLSGLTPAQLHQFAQLASGGTPAVAGLPPAPLAALAALAPAARLEAAAVARGRLEALTRAQMVARQRIADQNAQKNQAHAALGAPAPAPAATTAYRSLPANPPPAMQAFGTTGSTRTEMFLKQRQAERQGMSIDPTRRSDPAGSSSVAGFAPAATWLASADERRRREESFRGTMRGELARLMAACGDAQPMGDVVDVVEDMVVEWLADLCRPAGPVRPGPGQPHVAPTLAADTVRHRLGAPGLRKYRARWDHLAVLFAQADEFKRAADPRPQELIKSIGADFLGLNDDDKKRRGAGAGAGARGADKGKGESGEKDKSDKGEKGKRGPKKGFKRDLAKDGKKRAWKKKVGPSAVPSAVASPMG
ncbi:hypothetical protein Q5752_003717 [Cryptotrichosporon argae]